MIGKDESDSFVDQLLEKHSGLRDKHFRSSMDDISTILKAHLLVEELLRDFCAAIAHNPKHFRNARLTFKQVLEVTRAFMVYPGPKDAIEWVWTAVNLLNKTRNLYAHALEPTEDELAKCQSELVEVLTVAMKQSSTEQQSLKSLQSLLSFLLGALHILVSFSVELSKAGDQGLEKAWPLA